MRDLGPELFRRRVPAVLALYAAGALAALGTIDDLSEGLGWPPVVFDTALLLLSIGSLNALLAGWYHGAKSNQVWTRREVILHAAVVVVMIVLVVPFHIPDAIRVDPERVSVTRFTSGRAEAEVSGMITEEIARLVGRNKPERPTNPPGWIVTGSVRRVDQQLRIAVQLSRMPDGIQVWADRLLVPADSLRDVVRNLLPVIADSIRMNMNIQPGNE